MNGKKKEIPDYLPTWELLAKVAEDASGLARSALILRRTLDDLNPTGATFNQALAAFHEGWANVLLSLRQLNVIDDNIVLQIMKQNYELWLTKLKETYDREAPENEHRY